MTFGRSWTDPAREGRLLMRKSLITLSLLIVIVLPVSAHAQNSTGVAYEVYALSYGVYPDFPVSALLAGADKTRKIDLQMMIWLIKGPGGKNILVDTGCYHDKVMKGKAFKDYIKPSETLAKLGLKPEEITDVIISHMHWDHADGMDLFPNAKIWIQKDESRIQFRSATNRSLKNTSFGVR